MNNTRNQLINSAMESNELYELYHKIALDIAKKQKGAKGAVCVDTTFETALEFAKQYKEQSDNGKLPLHAISQQRELLTDFMEMIEEGGMIKFDKPILLNQFKNRR